MRTDRSKKESISKVQTNISYSIQHGFTRFQVQSTKQSNIYNISIMKSKISRINLWPLVATESDSAGIMPCNVQSLLLKWLWSWMEGGSQLNWTRFNRFKTSPLLFLLWATPNLHEFKWFLAWILISDDARWWTEQGLCKCYEEMGEKFERKLRAKIWDLKKWFVVRGFLLWFHLYTPN